jgi:hypothetical protein
MLNLVNEDIFCNIRGTIWYGVACPETQFTVCTLPFWDSRYIMITVFYLLSVMLPVINKNYLNALQDCESMFYIATVQCMWQWKSPRVPQHSTVHHIAMWNISNVCTYAVMHFHWEGTSNRVHWSIWCLFITGNFTLERLKLRWEENIKIDVKEIGWEKVDWIKLAQHRYLGQALVHIVMNFQVP